MPVCRLQIDLKIGHCMPLNFTAVNAGKANVNIHGDQKLDEVENVLRKIVHIQDLCHWFPFSVNEPISKTSINTVNIRLTPERLL